MPSRLYVSLEVVILVSKKASALPCVRCHQWRQSPTLWFLSCVSNAHTATVVPALSLVGNSYLTKSVRSPHTAFCKRELTSIQCCVESSSCRKQHPRRTQQVHHGVVSLCRMEEVTHTWPHVAAASTNLMLGSSGMRDGEKMVLTENACSSFRATEGDAPG